MDASATQNHVKIRRAVPRHGQNFYHHERLFHTYPYTLMPRLQRADDDPELSLMPKEHLEGAGFQVDTVEEMVENARIEGADRARRMT
jgi:hypothetical protein